MLHGVAHQLAPAPKHSPSISSEIDLEWNGIFQLTDSVCATISMTVTAAPPCSAHRLSSGQASSCHSEPKGWGPPKLYHITLCIVLWSSIDSDSDSSCQSHYKPAVL
jgi:hypothetical protein